MKVEGIENTDLSSLVSCHSDYNTNIKRILEYLGFNHY